MNVRKTQNGTLRKLTAKEGRELLDRQARRHLKMSGQEFMRRYKAGEFADVDTPEVMRVAMLLPFAR
jgi:ribosomal protein L21E